MAVGFTASSSASEAWNIGWQRWDIFTYLRDEGFRIGSIVGFISFALLLWLVWLIERIRRYGFGRQPSGGEWFVQCILPRLPERLAHNSGTVHYGSPFYIFMQRMLAKGVLSLEEDREVYPSGAPVYRLRLTKEDHNLRPFEQAFLRRLFPEGCREISSDKFFDLHCKEGFDPDKVLHKEIEAHDPSPARAVAISPLFSKIADSLFFFLLLGSCTAVLIEGFLQGTMHFVCGTLLVGFCALFIPLLGIPIRRTGGAIVGGVLTVIAIALIAIGIIALHLIPSLRLSPIGSIGIAMFALWVVTMLLDRALDSADFRETDGSEIHWAQHYVRSELHQTTPALEDSWIPHLLALGCWDTMTRWKRSATRSEADSISSDPDQCSSTKTSRPFIGDLSGFPNLMWIRAFHVLSEEEREERDEDYWDEV